MKREAVNLKQGKEGYMEDLKGRKVKCNFFIISKIKETIKNKPRNKKEWTVYIPKLRDAPKNIYMFVEKNTYF